MFSLRNHLFNSIRSPGPVVPEDVECEGFDITYTRIAGNKSSSSSARGGTTATGVLHNHHHHHHADLENDIDHKVDEAIESFLKSLSQIGPELLSVSSVFPTAALSVVSISCSWPQLSFVARTQGSLTLSFFERRASRQLFGLVSHEERVV